MREKRTAQGTGTIVTENDAELVAVIDAAGLGPVSAAEVRMVGDDGPGGADRVPVMFVELDAASRHKGRILVGWLDRIDVVDMVAGKFRASDPVLRLNIRGRTSVGPVVVVAPFSEQTEPHHTEVIQAQIGRQQPRRLVAALAALDDSAGAEDNT